MTRRKLIPPAAAADASRVLGQQVRQARADRRLTQKQLAARALVSPRTVSLIESGDPAVSVGNVFTVALAAGVPLFGAEDAIELATRRRMGAEKLALMPTRVVPEKAGDDGLDF